MLENIRQASIIHMKDAQRRVWTIKSEMGKLQARHVAGSGENRNISVVQYDH